MFIPLKSVLPQITNRVGISVAIKEDQIPLAYKKVVEEILNQKAASASRVLFLHHKILTIEVPSSAWACQLQFSQAEIVEQLNTLCGREVVERIIFRVTGN
ncbi:MAG: DUF721 domain-containing protein [Patescibacteria group bacterium]|nr:DUF721 domain-containing protein [Patescibacteria group bacterium]